MQFEYFNYKLVGNYKLFHSVIAYNFIFMI